MTAVAVMVDDAEPAAYRTCDNCHRSFAFDMVFSSSYEANGVGDTSQCMACLGHSAQEVAEQARACVEVVDHPGEMGPHQDAFCTACGTLGRSDEMDSDGECERCGYLGPGYTSRGDAHLMAVTAPGAR